MVQSTRAGKPDSPPTPGVYSDLPSFFTDGPEGAMNNEEFDVPEELIAVLDEHGLAGGKSFRCILKEVPEGASDSDGSYIDSWSRAVPSTNWIGLNFGPGDYLLQFMWRAKDEEGKYRNMSEKVPIRISDKYQDRYDDYQHEKRIKRAEEKRRKVNDARLRKDLEADIGDAATPGDEDQKRNAKEYLEEIREVAQMFGWNTGARQGLNMAEVLKSLAPFIPAVIAYLEAKNREKRDRDQQMMALLSGMANSSNQQLIEVLKNQNGPSTGSDIMKEISTMLFGALDIKDALTGQKKSPLDKVLETVEGVLPAVLSFAQMTKQQRENNLMYRQAAGHISNSPDFQAVMQDPELLRKAISHWDGHFGWEQTDAILTVAGIERPEDCPRQEGQRYPQGDERNESPGQEQEQEQDQE